MMFRTTAALAAAFLMTACASLSPRAALVENFIDFGLSRDRSVCLADELSDRLDRDDLVDIADYVGGLNVAESPGDALEALVRIENPRAAAAVARAGILCAFGGAD